MAGIGGDFTGFTFNGYYSADLGITRVSEGSRYNFDLLPTKSHSNPNKFNILIFNTSYWQSNIDSDKNNNACIFKSLSLYINHIKASNISNFVWGLASNLNKEQKKL